MTILVVAAHPDDEVLGCGASMAKWSNAGIEVNVLIMAEGATSRDKVRNREKRIDELSALAKSARSAGIKSIACSYGYRMNSDNPLSWGADYCVNKPNEIMEIIKC